MQHRDNQVEKIEADLYYKCVKDDYNHIYLVKPPSVLHIQALSLQLFGMTMLEPIVLNEQYKHYNLTPMRNSSSILRPLSLCSSLQFIGVGRLFLAISSISSNRVKSKMFPCFIDFSLFEGLR